MTGAAAEALRPDGLLNVATAGTREGEIPPEQARRLAVAFLAEYGPWMRGRLEQQRGASIAMDALRTCGRVLYAASSFGPTPAETPGVLQRLTGGWYQVPFCEGALAPAVVISVSALDTDVAVNGSGGLVFGAPRPGEPRGEEFTWAAISLTGAGRLAISPEDAVAAAAAATGRRVINLPELIAPSRTEGFPSRSRWRIVLDAPVRVRTAAGVSPDVRELFVGDGNARTAEVVAVPDAVQPSTVSFLYAPVDTSARTQQAAKSTAQVPAGMTTFAFSRLSGTPVRFVGVGQVLP